MGEFDNQTTVGGPPTYSLTFDNDNYAALPSAICYDDGQGSIKNYELRMMEQASGPDQPYYIEIKPDGSEGSLQNGEYFALIDTNVHAKINEIIIDACRMPKHILEVNGQSLNQENFQRTIDNLKKFNEFIVNEYSEVKRLVGNSTYERKNDFSTNFEERIMVNLQFMDNEGHIEFYTGNTPLFTVGEDEKVKYNDPAKSRNDYDQERNYDPRTRTRQAFTDNKLDPNVAKPETVKPAVSEEKKVDPVVPNPGGGGNN